MEYVIKQSKIEAIRDNFPKVIRLNEEDNFNLIKYYDERVKQIYAISKLIRNKNDDNITELDYFNELLEYCILKIDELDKEKYLSKVLGEDYSTVILKTNIPKINIQMLENYNYVPGCLTTILANGVFAISNDFIYDENHTYTVEEIIELQKQRKIRFLSLTDDGKKIDSYTYSRLSKDYKNSRLIPLDIVEVDSSNLLQLIKNYPCFFSFLRENIDCNYILEVYQKLIEELLDNEINRCNDIIEEYNKRIDNIKVLKKFNM